MFYTPTLSLCIVLSIYVSRFFYTYSDWILLQTLSLSDNLSFFDSHSFFLPLFPPLSVSHSLSLTLCLSLSISLYSASLLISLSLSFYVSVPLSLFPLFLFHFISFQISVSVSRGLYLYLFPYFMFYLSIFFPLSFFITLKHVYQSQSKCLFLSFSNSYIAHFVCYSIYHS